LEKKAPHTIDFSGTQHNEAREILYSATSTSWVTEEKNAIDGHL
jgi:hypothetical protein